MDQHPGQRALGLTDYFANRYGFTAEKYISGPIIFKRVNRQGVVERIVVKHARELPIRPDRRIREDEMALRGLWGAEHIPQLLAIVDDLEHESWVEPTYRALTGGLPWKLNIDHPHYRNVLVFGFPFFVTEYLSRGTGEELRQRCRDLDIWEISEPVLWYFLLCLVRACVGMSYPPRGKDAPLERREVWPQLGTRGSYFVHGNLTLENIMFGNIDARHNPPICHWPTPILKIIDFGITRRADRILTAEKENMFQVAQIIHSLATLDHDDRIAPAIFHCTGIPGFRPFNTNATQEFWENPRFSMDFKKIICRCWAVQEEDRPYLRSVLAACEENLSHPYYQNWRQLEGEVNDIFDTVPEENSDDSDEDYEP